MLLNLTWKIVVIIGVMLVLLFGIIGNPAELGKGGLVAAHTNRIHLGLDLKGGTHLILQVHVNDAVSAETDRAIERLKDDLANNKVTYTEIVKPDPDKSPEVLEVRGVSGDGNSTLRRVADERLPEFSSTSGANGSLRLTMKAPQLKELKDKAVQQAIQKIRESVDTLGVSGPVFQEHGLGENQILVQLPGIDDPERVKGIMQSTAMLEIRQAFGSSSGYRTEDEARQALSQYPNTVLL